MASRLMNKIEGGNSQGLYLNSGTYMVHLRDFKNGYRIFRRMKHMPCH